MLRDWTGNFQDGSGEGSVYDMGSDSSCEWLISPRAGAGEISIAFTTFGGVNRGFDEVKVYGCSEETCGQKLFIAYVRGQQTVEIPDSYALVSFNSKFVSNSPSGFSASWRSTRQVDTTVSGILFLFILHVHA